VNPLGAIDELDAFAVDLHIASREKFNHIFIPYRGILHPIREAPERAQEGGELP
jgi:hypothetical protein